MTVSGQLIVVSILFAVLMFAIAIDKNFRDKCMGVNGAGLFLLFQRAYMVGIIAYIVIYLTIGRHDNIPYLMQLFVWYSYCAILASMIIQSLTIFEFHGLWVKNCTAVLCYYSLFVVIIELFFKRYEFIVNSTGIDFYPGVIPKGLYFSFPIIIYYICMIFLLVNYRKTHFKIRERHLLKLALFAILPCFFGLVIESFLHVVLKVHYPVFFVLMVISCKFMCEIHIKNRSFKLLPEDFEGILTADKTDAIFICDDEQNILFQNRAAQINSQMFKDKYIGRKITDVFVIDQDVARAMKSNQSKDGLMAAAIYPLTEHKIVMSVEFIYDCCNEILCSIITIPNYDVALDENTFEDTVSYVEHDRVGNDLDLAPATGYKEAALSEEERMRVDTGTTIMLVDDDTDNLDRYEEFFKPYGIAVTRADGGRTALNLLREPGYDAIFISYDMKKLNGIETAKRIRSMGNEYYRDVPIIFILTCPVSDVYREMLDVSFNDYIEVPVSVRKLNMIMSRWLWRRYALTDRREYSGSNTRVVRYIENLEELYNDCLAFTENSKWSYIGYSLKGMKRLCAKLESKALIGACDNIIDIYIRGQYDQLNYVLTGFYTELSQVKKSSNFGMMY